MGAQKLLKTTNRGQTWQEISPDLTKHIRPAQLSVGTGFPAGRSLSGNDGVSAYGNITTIGESPKARGTIYVGTDDGNVQMTTDGGGHWTDLTQRFRLPEARYVSKVLASRHDARVAYVAFDGHWDDDMRPLLFKTTDAGATWMSIAGDIPAWKPIKTIEEDPRNPNLLFAGTEFGLYWSFDGGTHWSMAGGNVPPVIIDRIIIHPHTNDLILGTHGRGVIILEDIRPFEDAASAAAIRLFPLRPATEVQTYRDLPWPANDDFVARNSPIGTYVSYSIATESPRRDSVKIEVLAADGSVVGRMTGPDTKGTHRVVWDLRYQFPYVPPASDSGFYGPPRAPYVPAGEYTVRLTARGEVLTQKVQVRADPRGAGTADGHRARVAINLRARDVSRAYADAVTALDVVDSTLASMRTTPGRTPAVDSAIAEVATIATTLRQRARGNSITSGIGRLFDLTAAIESSSLPPTEMQQRSIDASVAEFADIVAKVNEVLTNKMPALRIRMGQPPIPAVTAIRPPTR